MNTRRWLLTGAFTVAGIAGAAAYDAATHEAHAADKHPAAVVEHPGGVLDHPTAGRLPEQASRRAKQVIDQVQPGKPKPKPKCDKPADEPEAVPAPKPDEGEPADGDPSPAQPGDNPGGDDHGPDKAAPPADTPDDPIVALPPIATDPAPEPTPAPDPAAVILPATDPAPLPDANDLPALPADLPALPADLPALPADLPALPADPAGLPVLIGPIPAAQPAPAAELDKIEPAAAVAALKVPDCADRPDDARSVNRDAIRQLIASLTEPAATPGAKPAHGCPGTPSPPLDRADCASTGATSSTQTGNGHIHADLAGSLTAPALTRLTHARPRSSIPAGRHTAIEPGPA